MGLIELLEPVIVVAILLIAGKFVLGLIFPKSKNKQNLLVYERKPFLFDTTSEFNLYKILLELFGDKYLIFPQVHYSHLIRPRKTTWENDRKYRSRIDRKSADFVLCDKVQVVPQLVIELDGSAHDFKSKQARDEFIDELTKVVGLPILHLKTGNLDRESIRFEVDKRLNKI